MKKAEFSFGWKELLEVLGLLLLFLIIIGVFYNVHLVRVGKMVGSQVDAGAVALCKQQMKVWPTSRDEDHDGFPDSCDLCLGGNDNTQDAKNDEDADSIPDACDNDTSPGSKIITIRAACQQKCSEEYKDKDCWDTQRHACILPCYRDRTQPCPKT